MADDLSDFQPVAAAAPAHNVSDFEPVSSPASARSPASTSDLSDFEPAIPDKVVDPKKAATMFSGMPVETGPHKFTGEHQYGALFTPPEITPKDIERVSPVLSAVNPLFGVTYGLLPRTTNVAASGAANVVSGFANMLNSDEGLLMLGTGGLPKAAQTAVGLAFAAHAIKDSPEAVSEFISAKTDEDRSKALTRILNNFAIGAGGILHGFGRPVPEAPGVEPQPAPTGKHAEIVNTARDELRRAADETTKEVEPVLTKLPGDTQDRVRGIIAKQASGTELSPDERATLIQVQSFAAQSARDQTTEQFTSPTASTPTSAPAAPAAPSTPSGIPAGSPPARSSLFAQAKQEAAVAPLVESAEAASDVTPAAAEAAKQAAAVIAGKASSPTADKPVAAALRFPDGQIVSGPVHGIAWDNADRAGLTDKFSKQLSDVRSGFVTKAGEFITAEEANARKGTVGKDASELLTSSPTAEVEPPATTGQAGAPTEAVEGQPSEEVPPATEAAGVKPSPLVGPALLQDGTIVAQGPIGKVHDDLVREGAAQDKDLTDATRGFHDENGQPLSRTEAAQRALDTGVIDKPTFDRVMAREPAENKGLHSEDLIAAKEETTPAEPQFVLPKRAEAAEDKMVTVDIGKFDQGFSRDPQYLGKGQEDVAGRRAAFEQFQKTGNPIETPEVYVSPDGKVTFINGRHRYATLRDQGRESMPVAMSEESIANAKKAGILKPESAEPPKTDTRKFKPEAIPDVLKELEEEKPVAPVEPEKTDLTDTASKSDATGVSNPTRIAESDPRVLAGIEEESRVRSARNVVERAEAKAQEQEKKATEAEAYLERTKEGHLRGNALHEAKSNRRLADAYRGDVEKAQQSLDEARKWKTPFVRQRIQAEVDAVPPVESAPETKPAPPAIDKDEAAKATRGIPGALGDAVRDVLLNDKSMEEAAADNGTTVGKVQDSVNRMRQYLSDKEAKAAAEEPKEEVSSDPSYDDLSDYIFEKHPQFFEATKYLSPSAQYEIHLNQWRKDGSPEISDGVTPAEPTAPKETWQRTRDEVAQAGDSLAAHRLAVRKAIGEGQAVPLEVLEDFKGSPWADKAREQMYGQQISDTLLGKILKGLTDEGNTLYSDPLFINSVGKPVLRAAVKILQEGIESGKLAGDAITDALGYLREHIPNLNEDKANEFFDQFFEKSDETSPNTETRTSEPVSPESPTSETAVPGDRASAGEADSAEARTTPVDPRATTEEGQRYTSNKNATVDAERKARGEPELMSEAAKSLGATWDEASRQVDLNREAGSNLVKELNGKPRTIGAVEEAILLHHKIDVMNDLSKNTEVALDANADAGDRAEARMTAARLMDQLNDIDEATRKAGTEWGRTGRFRQVLALEDYSLAKMLQRSELAKGRPLTEEEQVKVQQMSTRIADLEKKLAEHEQQADTRREQTKNADVDKAIEEMKKPATEADKYSQGILDRIRQGLQSQEDKAWARIRARLGKASAGVDPTVLYDVAVIGANRLFKTGLDFAKWSSEMAKTFADTLGDTITPHLQEIFEQSKKINDEAIEKGAPKELRDKLKTKPKDDAEARTQIVQTIANRSKAKESLGGQIKKLAENFVRNGITEREALVTAVHDAVKEALPEATRRDIRDSISGYGEYRELSQDEVQVKMRDLKGQMQQISKIEDLTGKGPTGKPKLPDPTGAQRRTKTAEERVLEQEVNRIKKESGLEQTDLRSLKGAMDAVKARLKNRIEDLQLAISKKEKLPAKGKALPDDPEVAQLRRDKDALQKEYDAFFAEPKLTPDQIALKVYKTRTAKRIADLQDRLARKDFSTKPRKLVPLDAEGQRLKMSAEKAKLEFDREAYKDKQAKRTGWEKFVDYIPKLSRAFILTGPQTIGKLFAAAVLRMGATPAQEVAGLGLKQLPYVRDVAARAPREGRGFYGRAESKALTEAFTTGMKDAWEKFRKGETGLDTTGGKKSIIPHEWVDFAGNIHGALKAPAVRNEFARSYEHRVAFNLDHGIDVTDPLVQTRIAVEAYRDAQRAIFMQDNVVVSAWSAAMKALERKQKDTGQQSGGARALQAGLKTLLPIVKIPTNIVAETMEYATGAVTGSWKLRKAFKSGIETLRPEEADLIMRHLKKGSLGGAAMLLGFLAPQVIGGYYQAGQKRRDSDVKAGHVRLYGHDVPPQLLHNPLVEQLQIGATIARVAKSKLRKKDQGPQGIPMGVLAAGLGLTAEVPFVREMTEVSKLFNPYEKTQFIGEFVRSRSEPQIMQWVAEQGDKSGTTYPASLNPWAGEVRQRKPETLTQHMKVGIPGLRKTVPLKKKSPYAAFSGAR